MAESLSDPFVSSIDSDIDPDENETSASELRARPDKQVAMPSLLDRLKSPTLSELAKKGR